MGFQPTHSLLYPTWLQILNFEVNLNLILNSLERKPAESKVLPQCPLKYVLDGLAVAQRYFAPAKLPPSPLAGPAPSIAILSKSGSADSALAASKPVFCIYDSDDSEDDSVTRSERN
jgi:hypothetical protein